MALNRVRENTLESPEAFQKVPETIMLMAW